MGLDQGLKGWGGVMSPASGGEVTNCCANCAEPSRPQQWEPDLPILVVFIIVSLNHFFPLFYTSLCCIVEF